MVDEGCSMCTIIFFFLKNNNNKFLRRSGFVSSLPICCGSVFNWILGIHPSYWYSEFGDNSQKRKVAPPPRQILKRLFPRRRSPRPLLPPMGLNPFRLCSRLNFLGYFMILLLFALIALSYHAVVLLTLAPHLHAGFKSFFYFLLLLLFHLLVFLLLTLKSVFIILLFLLFYHLHVILILLHYMTWHRTLFGWDLITDSILSDPEIRTFSWNIIHSRH